MNSLNLDSIVKDYSEINEVKGIFDFILDWAIILTTIFLYNKIDSIYLYPLAIIVIGARQHALGVISHDIVHYRFLKNRKLADLIGNIFITWPMFFTINGYRSMHLRHHKYVNTNEDPDLVRRHGKWDWVFPKSKIQIYTIFFMDITTLNTFQYLKKLFFFKHDKKLKEDYKKVPISSYYFQALYYVLLTFILYQTENISTYFIFWVVPMLTWLKLSKRIRAMSEHFGIPAGDYAELTRTVYTNAFGKFFISPHGINYHVDHHKYPSVPMYNLEAFHHKLKDIGAFEKMGHLSHGYFRDVMNEMSSDCQLNKFILHSRQ